MLRLMLYVRKITFFDDLSCRLNFYVALFISYAQLFISYVINAALSLYSQILITFKSFVTNYAANEAISQIKLQNYVYVVDKFNSAHNF